MRKIQIAVCSDLCIRLTWNLTSSCGQQQRLGGWSRMVVKKFQDGGRPLFQNRYIAISQWKIMQFWWNFVHSSRFWTSRDCIGQTLSSTERISCYYYYYYYLFCFAFFTQVAGQWPSNCRSRDTAVLDAPPVALNTDLPVRFIFLFTVSCVLSQCPFLSNTNLHIKLC